MSDQHGWTFSPGRPPADEMPAGVSATALGAARMRAVHLLADAEPKIFVDELALPLTGDDPEQLVRSVEAQSGSLPPRSLWLLRTQVSKDYLEQARGRGVLQYVILGAGLDSYAYRHRASLGPLRVFEVDTPDLLAWKRRRLDQLEIAPPPGCSYVPCDFETSSVEDALGNAGFRPDLATFIAWLGATQYLSLEAIESTLCWASNLRGPTEVVLTYVNREQAQAPAVQDGMQSMRAIGAAFVTLLTPGEAEALLVQCGFSEVTHLTVADANARYFAGRSDGLGAAELERLIVGSTPGHGATRKSSTT